MDSGELDSREAVPALVRLTDALEQAEGLDAAVHALEPHVRNAFGTGTRGAVLRGDWMGHALHPAMTDLALGSWMSASLLDVLGRDRYADAARSLVGVGLAAAGPTAWTGWAQWVESGPREKRVGLVHAVGNGVAIGLYAASWFARRGGRQGRGVGLALAGAAVSGVAGYLGGHLTVVRGVGTGDPAFMDGSD